MSGVGQTLVMKARRHQLFTTVGYIHRVIGRNMYWQEVGNCVN